MLAADKRQRTAAFRFATAAMHAVPANKKPAMASGLLRFF